MFSKKGTPDLAVVGCIIGVIALIVGMVGIATPAPTLGSTPPNHPPLMFWGTPPATSGSSATGHSHSINYNYNDVRKTTTTTITSQTFTDILTFTRGSSPMDVWAYAECYLNATGTYALRLYDKTAPQLAGSPHPDVEYQISETLQHIDFMMGTFVFAFPITAHTFAIQGRVTAANLKLTCLKEGWHEYVPASITAPDNSVGTVNQGLWSVFPSAYTEAPATQALRLVAQLQSQTTQARLEITITASAVFGAIVDTSAFIWVQYSSDSGATWHNLCGGTDGGGDGRMTPRVDVTQAPSVTPYSSSFCTIASGAFASGGIIMRIVGDGGDDATTFQASLIELELSP